MSRWRARDREQLRALDALRSANPAPQSDVDTSERDARAQVLFERVVATPRVALPRGRVPRWTLLTSLAAAAAAALVVVLVMVQGAAPQASAAELLEKAATAATTTYQEIPGEREAYQKATTVTEHQVPGYRYTLERDTEVWVMPEGSARTKTTVSPPRFADRREEAAWQKAGRPALPGMANPSTTEGPVLYPLGKAQLDYGRLRALPMQPGPLSARLRQIAPDQTVFASARELLTAPGVPGPLRAALYRVIAGVPDVRVTEHADGRVTVEHQSGRVTFDPRSGALLAATGDRGGEVIIQSAGLVDCTTQGEPKPASITLTCADAGYAVRDLRWSSWGGQVAEASGMAWVMTCEPDCATGGMRRYPVSVRFEMPRACGLNVTNYTRIKVIYLADVPEGLHREDVTERPCTP